MPEPTPDSAGSTQISVRLRPPVREALDQRVRVEGTTRTEVVDAALRAYLGDDGEDDRLEGLERRVSRMEEVANL